MMKVEHLASYNPGHNIFELQNVLLEIQFTTSKTKLDIQYSKLGIRVASRVAEGLNIQDLRKLGNIRKISNLGGHIAQCLVSLQELRFCQQQLKNTQKQIPNFSSSIQFYRITQFCSKYFVWECLGKEILALTQPSPLAITIFLTIFITPKQFCELQ